MGEKLNKSLVQICKSLPRDFTIFEENGVCKFPNEYCLYCVEHTKEDYFCHKKTYTPDLSLSPT